MQSSQIPFAQTKRFSKLFLDYIEQKEALKPFYSSFPSLENFDKIIQQKKIFKHRKILVERLESQYSEIENRENVNKNLELLKKENTFTITTGHQLNIATGPLYFIYKIITAINTCKSLKIAHPQYDFVPIYWMASEDHDYEEIKSFLLFGKNYIWNTQQYGAVGRFHLQEIEEILSELPEKIPVLEEAYKTSKNLSEATRKLVHQLFGKYGLVVLNADDTSLKHCFTPYLKQEIDFNTSHKTVTEQSDKLAQLGYPIQVNPREINLFYLKDNTRTRIIKEDGILKSLDGNIIVESPESHPELYSPNVILRPLYQEVILPNLAYIGGPGELAYWFQLKSMFEEFKVNFPVLMPRNHALVTTPSQVKKAEKLKISLSDLFNDNQDIKSKYIKGHQKVLFELTTEKDKINLIFDKIKNKIITHDKSLLQAVEAENHKMIKQIETLEKRTYKSIERSHEQGIKQLENLKRKLFPKDSLQERVDNVFSFLINDTNFISKLIVELDAFNFKYYIINNG